MPNLNIYFNNYSTKVCEWNNNCFIKKAQKILRILRNFFCKNN